MRKHWYITHIDVIDISISDCRQVHVITKVVRTGQVPPTSKAKRKFLKTGFLTHKECFTVFKLDKWSGRRIQMHRRRLKTNLWILRVVHLQAGMHLERDADRGGHDIVLGDQSQLPHDLQWIQDVYRPSRDFRTFLDNSQLCWAALHCQDGMMMCRCPWHSFQSINKSRRKTYCTNLARTMQGLALSHIC